METLPFNLKKNNNLTQIMTSSYSKKPPLWQHPSLLSGPNLHLMPFNHHFYQQQTKRNGRDIINHSAISELSSAFPHEWTSMDLNFSCPVALNNLATDLFTCSVFIQPGFMGLYCPNETTRLQKVPIHLKCEFFSVSFPAATSYTTQKCYTLWMTEAADSVQPLIAICVGPY